MSEVSQIVQIETELAKNNEKNKTKNNLNFFLLQTHFKM